MWHSTAWENQQGQVSSIKPLKNPNPWISYQISQMVRQKMVLKQKDRNLFKRMKRKNRNLTMIGRNMDSTFALRRRELIHTEPPVTMIMEKWPAIFSESQVFFFFSFIQHTELLWNVFSLYNNLNLVFFLFSRIYGKNLSPWCSHGTLYSDLQGQGWVTGQHTAGILKPDWFKGRVSYSFDCYLVKFGLIIKISAIHLTPRLQAHKAKASPLSYTPNVPVHLILSLWSHLMLMHCAQLYFVASQSSSATSQKIFSGLAL